MTAEHLRPGVAAANVKDGRLDGFFIIGGVPVPAIHDLAAETPVRLIPVEADVLAKCGELDLLPTFGDFIRNLSGDHRGDTVDRL